MPDFSDTVFRALILALAGKQPRLSILIYHRVLPESDWMRPAEPSAVEFRWQMRLVRRFFNVMSLAEATVLLSQGKLPPRSVCITFDDGYADNATVALPILKEMGLPATVFVSSGFLNGGRMWNDTIVETLRISQQETVDLTGLGLPEYALENNEARRKSAYDIIAKSKHQDPVLRNEIVQAVQSHAGDLPNDLMLKSGDLKVLASGSVDIGGHTITHPILRSLTLSQAEEEICSGKSELELLTGSPVRLFAYPNGRRDLDYNEQHVAIVKRAGFQAAVSTNWGVSTSRSDIYQLPRFTPWDRSALKYLLRFVWNMRQKVEKEQ